MKQSPFLDAVQERMKPGHIARDGFMGNDRRQLIELLEEDENAVHNLGVTHEQISDRLGYFAEAGKEGLGTTVTVDGDYEVRVDDVRGVLPCPWGHKGLYPKTNIFFKNLKTGEEMIWTALQIHLIRDHGFYEGKGSHFRIEPDKAKRTLGL